MEILAITIASVLFLAGIVGSVVPVLPGAILIWSGMLIYGLIAGFEELTPGFFVVQGLLALTVMGVDYITSGLGSRFFGGSKASFLGAACGLLVGLFFFPIGLLVGPFAGAVVAELIFSRKAEQAVRSGVGASIGFWAGVPIKLALEAGMITWFFVRIL